METCKSCFRFRRMCTCSAVFTDFCLLKEDGPNPLSVLQFDRFEPSTPSGQSIFPQVQNTKTPIDSIADWTVWRVGVAQVLETRGTINITLA